MRRKTKTKLKYRVGSYIDKFTLNDAKTIAEQVFGEVEDVQLCYLTDKKSKKLPAKVLQFMANEIVCRYKISDFGISAVRPKELEFYLPAQAEKLSEMYSAYTKFMKTAKDSEGNLRFPDFEKDLNETLGVSSQFLN